MGRYWFQPEDMSGGQVCTPNVLPISGDFINFDANFSYVNSDVTKDHYILLHRNEPGSCGFTESGLEAIDGDPIYYCSPVGCSGCNEVIDYWVAPAGGGVSTIFSYISEDDLCLSIIDEDEWDAAVPKIFLTEPPSPPVGPQSLFVPGNLFGKPDDLYPTQWDSDWERDTLEENNDVRFWVDFDYELNTDFIRISMIGTQMNVAVSGGEKIVLDIIAPWYTVDLTGASGSAYPGIASFDITDEYLYNEDITIDISGSPGGMWVSSVTVGSEPTVESLTNSFEVPPGSTTNGQWSVGLRNLGPEHYHKGGAGINNLEVFHGLGVTFIHGFTNHLTETGEENLYKSIVRTPYVTGGLDTLTIETSSSIFTWNPSGAVSYLIDGTVPITLSDLRTDGPACFENNVSDYTDKISGSRTLWFDYLNPTYDQNHHLILYSNGQCGVTGASGARILDEFVVSPSTSGEIFIDPALANIDPNFVASLNNAVRTTHFDPSSSILAFGGEFTNFGGDSEKSRFALADLSGNPVEFTVNQPTPNNTVHAIGRDVLNDRYYIGGQFTQVDGNTVNRFVSISGDGNLILRDTLNFNGTVYGIDVDNSDGTVYVGGGFTQTFSNKYYNVRVNKNDSDNQLTQVRELNNFVHNIARDTSRDITYMVGEFTSVGNKTRNRFVAISGDDTLIEYTVDPNLSSTAYSVAVRESDGRIFVGGAFTGFFKSFDVDGNEVAQPAFDGAVNAVEYDSNNDIVYVGGVFTTVGGQSRPYFAALSGDQLYDMTYQLNIDGPVEELELKSDGSEIYLGGDFSNANSNNQFYQRRGFIAIDDDGTIVDYTKVGNPQVNNTVYAIARDEATGKIWIGGDFTENHLDSIEKIAKVDLSDTSTIPFSILANDRIYCVAYDSVKDVYYIGGDFTKISGRSRNRFAAFTGSGDIVNYTTNPDFNSSVRDIKVDESTGYVYIGGAFTSPKFYFATMSGDGDIIDYADDPSVNQAVYAIEIDESSDRIYLGGAFTIVNGKIRNRFAVLDRTDMSVLSLDTNDPNFNLSIWDIHRDETNDRTYIGGDFSQALYPANRFMAVDVNNDEFIRELTIDSPSRIYAVAKDKTRNIYYVGGDFTTINGQTRVRFAAISGDGTLIDYSPVTDPYFNSSVRSIDIDEARNIIYVGGQFSTTNGDTAKSYFTAINGNDGTIISVPEPSSTVYAVKYDQVEDVVYIGGNFTTMNDGGSQPRQRIAAISGSDQSLISYSPDPIINSTVWSIETNDSDGTVYVGGQFGTVNGAPQSRFVTFDKDMNPIKLEKGTRSYNGTVFAVQRDQTNDKIYLGGDFTSTYLDVSRFAQVDTVNNEIKFDIPIDANGGIFSIIKDETSNIYYIGGQFTEINGESRQRFAAISGDGTLIDYSPVTNPYFNSGVNVLKLGSNGIIYVGGSFSSSNGDSTKSYLVGISAADGSLVDMPEPNSRVNDISINPNNSEIYVVGNFTYLYDGVSTIYRDRFAAISGDNQTVINYATNPQLYAEANACEVDTVNNHIYVGGKFDSVNGGISRGYFATFDLNDKSLVSQSVNPEFNNYVRTIHYHESQDRVYVGGDFWETNQPAQRLLTFDVSNNEVVNEEYPNGTVRGAAYDSVRDIYYYVGDFTTFNGQNRQRFAAISGDGTMINYSTNPYFYGSVYNVVVNENTGRVYVGGGFNAVNGNYTRENFIGIDTDGSIIDMPTPSSTCYSLAIDQTNDMIYVGGNFSLVEGNSRGGYAKISGSGVLQSDSPMFNNYIRALDYDPINGRVYACGDFTTVNGQTRNRFAAINASNGSLISYSPATEPEFDHPIRAVKYNSTTDTIWAGGDNSNTSTHIYSISASNGGQTGYPVTPFDAFTYVDTLAIDEVNDIVYAGGTFEDPYRGVYAISGNGTLLPNVDYGIGDTVYTLIFDGNDDLIVGGEFLSYRVVDRERFASISGANGEFISPEGINFSSRVRDFQVDFNDNIYVGGEFINFGGDSSRDYVVKLDDEYNLVTNFNPGFNNQVYSLYLENDSLINIGGNFTQASEEDRRRFAAISGNGEFVLPQLPNSDFVSSVYSIDVDEINERIFVGGNFNQFDNDTTKRYLVALSGSGSYDTSLTAHPNSTVRSVVFDSTTQEVYAAGDFTEYQLANNLIQYYTAIDSDGNYLINNGANIDINGSVYTIEEDDNTGRIYVGGGFTAPSSYFAALDNNGTTVVTSGNVSLNTRVRTINVDQSTGDIHIGGEFIAVSPTDTQTISINRFNKLTGDNEPITVEINLDVYAAEYDHSEDILYIGGTFTLVNGEPRQRFAAISMSGSGDLIDYGSNNPEFDGTIRDIKLNSTTGIIYVGGQFGEVNADSNYSCFAALNKSDLTLRPEFPDTNSTVWTISVDELNNIVYIGGQFVRLNNPTSTIRGHFAAISGDGTILDYEVNPNVNGIVYEIEHVPSLDRVYIGGQFSAINSNTDYLRWGAIDTTDGSLVSDTSKYRFNNTVWSINYNPDDEVIYVGGDFSNMTVDGEPPAFRTRFAAFDVNSNNLLDLPNNPKFNSQIENIEYEAGKLYITGQFTDVSNEERFRYAVLDTNGNVLDISGNPQYDSTVYTQVFGAGDTIYHGGTFNNSGLIPTLRYCKLNSDFELQNVNSEFNGTVFDSLISDDLYLVGDFTDPGIVTPLERWACISGSQLDSTSLPDGFNSTVRDITVDQTDGTVYFSGAFTNYNGNTDYIVAISGGDTQTSFDADVSSPVNDVELDSPNLYLGGEFVYGQYRDRDRFAAIDVDGNLIDYPVNPSFSNTVRAIDHDPVNDITWVGGDFVSVNSQFSPYIAGITGNGGIYEFDNQPDFDGSFRINALDVDSVNEELYIGTVAGSNGSNAFIVDYTGDTTILGVGGPLASVNAIRFDPNSGNTYLGGTFEESTGAPNDYMTVIDISGNANDEWLQAAFNDAVAAISVDPSDGRVFVGGNFTDLNGLSSMDRLASLKTTNTGFVVTPSVSSVYLYGYSTNGVCFMVLQEDDYNAFVEPTSGWMSCEAISAAYNLCGVDSSAPSGPCENPDTSPQVYNVTPDIDGSTYYSDSYAENGQSSIEINETCDLDLSSVTLEFDWQTDSFGYESGFHIQSPDGTKHGVLTDYGNPNYFPDESYGTESNTYDFSSDTNSNGTWNVSALDSYGDGGISISNITITFNNGFIAEGGVEHCGSILPYGRGYEYAPPTIYPPYPPRPPWWPDDEPWPPGGEWPPDWPIDPPPDWDPEDPWPPETPPWPPTPPGGDGDPNDPPDPDDPPPVVPPPPPLPPDDPPAGEDDPDPPGGEGEGDPPQPPPADPPGGNGQTTTLNLELPPQIGCNNVESMRAFVSNPTNRNIGTITWSVTKNGQNVASNPPPANSPVAPQYNVESTFTFDSPANQGDEINVTVFCIVDQGLPTEVTLQKTGTFRIYYRTLSGIYEGGQHDMTLMELAQNGDAENGEGCSYTLELRVLMDESMDPTSATITDTVLTIRDWANGGATSTETLTWDTANNTTSPVNPTGAEGQGPEGMNNVVYSLDFEIGCRQTFTVGDTSITDICGVSWNGNTGGGHCDCCTKPGPS